MDGTASGSSIGHSGTDGVLRTYRKLQNAPTVLQDQKTIENPPDQWKIFRNTHEAIVDEETFDRVQELRRNKRRPAKTGKITLFVLPLGRKAKMCVEHTLSVQWYWKRVY